jgi:hypothetical protein
MTEPQRKKFSRILDVNWEIKELQQAGKWANALEKVRELDSLKKDLRDDMGHKEYDLFIENGRKMFAPKTSEE